MANIELLAPGAKADSGASAAVNVSPAQLLRQRINVSPETDLGILTQLRVSIETAASASGPWREVATATMRPTDPAPGPFAFDHSKRIIAGDLEDFARVVWATEKRDASAASRLSFGVAGEGV